MKGATKKTMGHITHLKRRPDFLRVQSAGQKWVSTAVIVIAAPSLPDESGNGKPVRFGLTVTKKLSKSAVVRNRARRRLRAAAYDVLPGQAREGMDYVFIGRAETGTLPYDKLCSDLKWCLKRLSCLKETPS